jgi:hypothetical protein
MPSFLARGGGRWIEDENEDEDEDESIADL